MKKINRNNLISFVISAGGVMAMSQMLLQEGRGLGYTNSFLPVLVFALCFPAVHKGLWGKEQETERGKGWMQGPAFHKKPVLTVLFAFAFVCCMTVGNRLESSGYLPLGDVKMWISIPFSTMFWAVLFGNGFEWLERLTGAEETGTAGKVKKLNAGIGCKWDAPALWKKRLAVAGGFLIVWGIVLLAVWPGFFVYDAQDEFIQVETRNFSTHHPLSHVLLLGGIISAGKKLFGSYNAGIACYMLFQMILMSACFTYVWDHLRRRKAPGWLRIGSVVYFALFPLIQMYVLCSAKDTLYSAGMLLVIVLLLEAVEEGKTFWGWNFRTILLTVSLFVMGIMRNNGLYILILMIPVMGMMLYRKRITPDPAGEQAAKWRNGAAVCGLISGIAALALCMLVSCGLKTAFHAEEGGKQEMLTVPIQQLARTWKQEPELFNEKEKEILYSYIPEEALEQYRPKLSDGVKVHFDNEQYAVNPGDFWKLWLKTGMRAPVSYLNAWLMTSYGFWYPEAVIDVYSGNQVFTFTYEDSSYFGFETELPGTRESKIPWLEEMYRRISLELSFQKIPLVSMLFSPGFLFWVYAAGMVLLLRNQKIRTAAAFLPAVLNWLTVLLGPTYVVRYVLIWWFALPVLAEAVLAGRENSGLLRS